MVLGSGELSCERGTPVGCGVISLIRKRPPPVDHRRGCEKGGLSEHAFFPSRFASLATEHVHVGSAFTVFVHGERKRSVPRNSGVRARATNVGGDVFL